MQRTLVFLKPDAWLRKYIGALVLEELVNLPDLNILSFNRIPLSQQMAEKHYEEHVGKSFFNPLIDFICLSPVLAMEIEGDNIINRIRTALGKTFVQEAAPNSIRGKLGIWAGINLVHASDSPQSAERELKVWKEMGVLNPTEDATRQVKDYISNWIDVQVNQTAELRGLCKRFTENLEKKDEIINRIYSELQKECVGANPATITNFSNVIIDNVIVNMKK